MITCDNCARCGLALKYGDLTVPVLRVSHRGTVHIEVSPAYGERSSSQMVAHLECPEVRDDR